jgi:hypothetical protein
MEYLLVVDLETGNIINQVAYDSNNYKTTSRINYHDILFDNRSLISKIDCNLLHILQQFQKNKIAFIQYIDSITSSNILITNDRIFNKDKDVWPENLKQYRNKFVVESYTFLQGFKFATPQLANSILNVIISDGTISAINNHSITKTITEWQNQNYPNIPDADISNFYDEMTTLAAMFLKYCYSLDAYCHISLNNKTLIFEN